jgi:2-dehydro-3-deoxygluconokinase
MAGALTMRDHSATSPTAVTLGETMALARATEVGAFDHVSSLHLGIGGAESNVAIALTRLGIPTRWIGRVGADSLGDLVVRELRAEGLRLDVTRDETAATGLMLKERRTAASTKVWYYRAGSAGSRLAASDVDPEHIRSASLLHVTGITLALSASARDAVRSAIDIAREAGVPISFDLNYRSALWTRDEAAAQFSEIVPLVDIVFGGDDELSLVVDDPASPEDLGQRVAELGPAQVVVKLGARGCVAIVDGSVHTVRAMPVDAIDTVGAGDAFVGAYLAELLLGETAATRLDTAVIAGAFACLVPGDWEGMPKRSELRMLGESDPVQR